MSTRDFTCQQEGGYHMEHTLAGISSRLSLTQAPSSVKICVTQTLAALLHAHHTVVQHTLARIQNAPAGSARCSSGLNHVNYQFQRHQKGVMIA